MYERSSFLRDVAGAKFTAKEKQIVKYEEYEHLAAISKRRRGFPSETHVQRGF